MLAEVDVSRKDERAGRGVPRSSTLVEGTARAAPFTPCPPFDRLSPTFQPSTPCSSTSTKKGMPFNPTQKNVRPARAPPRGERFRRACLSRAWCPCNTRRAAANKSVRLVSARDAAYRGKGGTHVREGSEEVLLQVSSDRRQQTQGPIGDHPPSKTKLSARGHA